MKKNAATSRQPSELRQGSASGRGAEAATWPRSTRVSTSQSTNNPSVTAENTSSGSRQSPSACSSGTAVAEDTVAPTLIPAA